VAKYVYNNIAIGWIGLHTKARKISNNSDITLIVA